MKKKFITYCIPLSMIIINGCGDKELCFTPPEPFRAVILNDLSENLIDTSRVDGLKGLFYKKEGTETPLSFEVIKPDNQGLIYLESAELPWKSEEGNKTFFIRLKNGLLDSLEIDVVKKSQNDCTSYSYQSVKYNGMEETEKDPLTGAYVIRH